MLFAYLGPDTVLPMTSMVAAAVGFLLMFGRQVVHLCTCWSPRFVRAIGRSLSPTVVEGRLQGKTVRRDGPVEAGPWGLASHSHPEHVNT